MTSYPGPVVNRALLITELRGLWRGTGVVESVVASRLGWSYESLAQVENWTANASIDDLETLLRFYELTAERKQRLRELARKAREPAWWEPYRAELDDPALSDYLGYEGGAVSIKGVEPLAIPGLLQTRTYAWEILRRCKPGATPERLDGLTELRMIRQQLLNSREGPPIRQVHLIDEAAIRRGPAPAEVMAEQLDRLLSEAERPTVTVLVLPLDATHTAYEGPFWLLDCEAGVDDVLHLERTPKSSTYIGGSPEIAEYRVAFAELHDRALDEERSVDMIRKWRNELATGTD